MPPHSEMENDAFSQMDDVKRRKRRKRSRSISPKYLSHGENNNNNSNNNNNNNSNRSSRSSSAVSEFRGKLTIGSERSVAVRPPSPQPVVVDFHEAPSFLQFNPFIYRGYRANLDVVACLKSVFWWTNETLNTWTHLLGWIYFAYFTVQEIIQFINNGASPSLQDSLIMIMILVCFQICMAMSAGYHTFCCHSSDSYHCWLSYDLCGISFSLLAIYVTGIYYAFWCQSEIRSIYIGISVSMFLMALLFQTTPKFLTDDYSNIRLIFFLCWSTFGFIPCIHWVVQNGGITNTRVFDLVSQIGIMYIVCGLALFFYVTKIPEIWFPGSVDFVGSSHQWWHVIIFLAFYHWQNSGKYFAAFRAHHGCFEEMLPDVIDNNTSTVIW